MMGVKENGDGLNGSVWICGTAVCWLCGNRWVAVMPRGAEVLGCPSCGEMMGVGEEAA